MCPYIPVLAALFTHAAGNDSRLRLWLYPYHVFVCGWSHATERIWRTQDSSWESVPPSAWCHIKQQQAPSLAEPCLMPVTMFLCCVCVHARARTGGGGSFYGKHLCSLLLWTCRTQGGRGCTIDESTPFLLCMSWVAWTFFLEVSRGPFWSSSVLLRYTPSQHVQSLGFDPQHCVQPVSWCRRIRSTGSSSQSFWCQQGSLQTQDPCGHQIWLWSFESMCLLFSQYF